jgi:hypothetical protein
MKKPDLLILVAIWNFLSAFWALVGMAAIAIFAYPAVSNLHGVENVAAVFVLTVGILILFIALVIAVAGGIGILVGKEWGRILSLVHAAFSLLAIPFGTIIGILVIIYLINPEVREFFQPSTS